MKKALNIICVLILLTLTRLNAQEAENVWPVKGLTAGEGIIYKPQDYINNEFNFDDVFISANKGTEVIAPCSGIIKTFMYSYKKSLTYSYSFKHEYKNSKSATIYDREFRNRVANDEKINPKFISIVLGLEIKKGEIYYISGLRPTRFFKTGTKISKGELIGRVGYAYKEINKPCISISRSINSHPADPMVVFGIASSFIPLKGEKIDYLTFKHGADKLIEDFNVFKAALEEGHPGLYDYVSKPELDKLFEQVKAKIKQPMTSEEFRLLLLAIINQIHDSHTALYSKKYKTTDGSRPPILFGLDKDSLVVYSTLAEYKSLLNKKIITVDGKTLTDIKADVRNLIYGADGYIESLKNRDLFLYFWRYYSKLSHKKNGSEIKVQFSDNSTETLKYGYYKAEKYSPRLKKRSSERISFSVLSNKTAFIGINTFQLLDTDIDSIGTFIKQISDSSLNNLIIDVRDNYGGDENMVSSIFSFIAKAPFRQTLYQKVNKKGAYDFFKYTYNYSPQESSLFNEYKKIGNKAGFYLSENEFPVTRPNKDIHFDGNVYVWTNELSLSAATIFPALVYKYKRGTIIGRETGSTYYQLNAVKFAQVFLKNTGLELYMPLVKTVFDKKGSCDIPWGRGVLPEFQINFSCHDFFNQDNVFIDSTTNIIKQKEKSEKKN